MKEEIAEYRAIAATLRVNANNNDIAQKWEDHADMLEKGVKLADLINNTEE